jgi:hypothetical protein
MSLLIRHRDVYGQPLDDRADVQVIDTRTERTVDRMDNKSTTVPTRATHVEPNVVYKVRVFPSKHRPVGRFVRVPASGESIVEIHYPILPIRVTGVRFPPYEELDVALRAVLEKGNVEDHPEAGRALYEGIGDLERAGLLNIWAKMLRTPLSFSQSRVSDFVDALYRVRGDRFFADVTLSLRDLVKTATAAGQFDPVPEGLHTPPPGFEHAGSYKTRDTHGNLQLTFFASTDPPLRFRVDADIDETRGIEHLFEVLQDSLTGRETHPYDVHEILVFAQQLDPGYTLTA